MCCPHSTKVKDTSKSIATNTLELEGLRDIWTQLLQSQSSASFKNRLLEFREKMKVADNSLDATLAKSASLQAELRSFQPVVLRQEQLSNEKYMKTLKDVNDTKAELAATLRLIKTAKSKDVRMAAAQQQFVLESREVLLQPYLSEAAAIKKAIQSCATITRDMSKIDQALTLYRNGLTTANDSLEKAITKEQLIIGSSSERLAAYYKAQVGRKMTELFKTVFGP